MGIGILHGVTPLMALRNTPGTHGPGSCRVTAEEPGVAEFTQFMPHHVFRHQHILKDFAIMNLERVADKFGHNRASPCPSLDRLTSSHLIELLHLAIELLIHKRAFFQ